MGERIRIGVLGAGHWGPHLIRNFLSHPETTVAKVCDLSPSRRAAIASHYPEVAVVDDPASVIGDPSLGAIVVATPTATHGALVRAALAAGKDVLVEKPLCVDAAEADALVALAAKRGRILMTGHVFLFNRAVQELKRRLADPAFGDLYYFHARRTNLGPVRDDVHAGWDLAAHDISIFLYLKGELPVEVTASAAEFIRGGVPDVVFATLFFADGTSAHLHCSWLDPQKVRHLTVVGQHQMLVFDDMNLLEPIRIFNKGFDRVGSEGIVDSFARFRVELREGDVVIPRISTGEPLRTECEAFVEAMKTRVAPLSDGRLGADVVRILAALDRSIAAGSKRVPVA